MDIKEQLKNQVKEAVKSAFGIERDFEIETPKDPTHGDFSTNAAMILVKELKKSPVEIAESIAGSLRQTQGDTIEQIEVVKPGFINFRINTDLYKEIIAEILEKGDLFGQGTSLKGKRIMMEFAHPNPFKSFHIGHLRNIILGESLIRLLENEGAEVIRVNYQGDVGMHIAKCLWSFRNIDPKDYPETADAKVALLGKCYAEGAKAFEESEESKKEIKTINKKIYSKEDPEITNLWDLGKKWSLEKFHEIYTRLGTTFVREYMESEVEKLGVEKVKEALSKGILKESDGAIIFDGKDHGLDTRVFLNSEGLPTYEGKELGLAYHEFTDYGHIDMCIHNVAIEQISFFKVTFKVQELLDPELFKGKQYHNAYEFVGLKSGKMSSRTGNVVLGNDILNQAAEKIADIVKDRDTNIDLPEKLGVGAVKYSFLKISPKTYLTFSLEESLSFEGDSGPYIMYTFVRANSILSQATEIKIEVSNESLVALNKPEEMDLIKHLNIFQTVAGSATKEYSPNQICQYLYELCQLFNKFYTQSPILNADNDELKLGRLALTKATSQVLKNGLNLLGIETVDKM